MHHKLIKYLCVVHCETPLNAYYDKIFHEPINSKSTFAIYVSKCHIEGIIKITETYWKCQRIEDMNING